MGPTRRRWAVLVTLATVGPTCDALGVTRLDEPGGDALNDLRLTSVAHPGPSSTSPTGAAMADENQWLTQRLAAFGSTAKHILTASPAAIFTEMTGRTLPILHPHDSKTIETMITRHNEEMTLKRSFHYILATGVVGGLALLQLWGGFAEKRARSAFSQRKGHSGGQWGASSEVELSAAGAGY
uniref:Uncharacterized protein n=1 Tax=Alexandrium catenella TaxID=2925 RepID=A0A7S1WEA0_ALECA